MSAANKAVFLSYASQDAEAARRIAETLRAADIEVWFDQAELVGGDAWDRKIRDQIASCALFLPVISATTQARTEGYFRLEWKLAAQRTHMMSERSSFLLPIVIDDTPDASADVPTEFKAVQWTRLRPAERDFGGQARSEADDDPALRKFCGRVQTLLHGSVQSVAGVADPGSGSERPGAAPPATTPRRGLGLTLGAATAIAVGIAAAFWSMSNSESSSPPDNTPAATSADVVENPLGATVWRILNSPLWLTRAELDGAGDLAEQWLAQDNTNAEAWAAWATINLEYTVKTKLDDTSVRRTAAREASIRALQLDPSSFEARLARARVLAPERGTPNPARIRESETILRSLLAERPGEPRVQLELAVLLLPIPDRHEEGLALLHQVTQDPAYADAAWGEIGLNHWGNNHFSEIEPALSHISAKTNNNLYLAQAVCVALHWHGDLDGARALLDQASPAILREEWGAPFALRVHEWRRDSAACLQVLDEYSRDWVRARGLFDGPTEFLRGQVHRWAGSATLAERDFTRALAKLNERLLEEPDNTDLLQVKAMTLHYLDRAEEAQQTFNVVREMYASWWAPEALLNPADEVIDKLEAEFDQPNFITTAATLRYSQWYDPIRDHPRFQALLARAEASPKHTPNPKVATTPAIPAKSIAVLPFANRSASADDAYFTDGIHDDLLTHISRIKELRTTSRTSVMTYRDTLKSTPEIGQELRVAHILEGGVQRAGNQIRINVQLIDAAEDEHVWAEIYTREMSAENVFAIQTEIATDIAAQLQAVLSPEEQERLSRLPTDNLAALEAYFQGKRAWDEASVEGFEHGRDHFQHAVELDPNFADAHAALATSYLSLIWNAGLPPAEQITKAEPHVMKALKLDPHSSAAHIALSQLHGYSGRSEEAEQSLRRAIELDPNNVEAYANLAGRLVYMKFDQLEEAIALADRALELDPQFHHARANKATALAHLGRKEESRRERQYIITAMGDNDGHSLRALADLEAYHFNRYDEAIKSARLAYQLDPRSPASARLLAQLYDNLDMREESVAWWQRAIDVSPAGQETDYYRFRLTLTQGDRKEARRQAEAMVTKNPDFWTANLAQSWLNWENYHELRYDHVIDQLEGRYPGLATADPASIEGNFRQVGAYTAALVKAGREDHALKVEQIWQEVTRDFPLFGHFGVGMFRPWMKLTVGDKEAAKTLLMAGRQAGDVFDFSRGKFFSQDIHAAFQDDPDYQAMLKDMQAELAAQRANIERMEAAGELAPIPPLPEETL